MTGITQTMRKILRSSANDVGSPVPTVMNTHTLDPSAVAAHVDDSVRIDILLIPMRGTCENDFLVHLKRVVDEYSFPLGKRVCDHFEFPEAFRAGALVRMGERIARSENAFKGLLIILSQYSRDCIENVCTDTGLNRDVLPGIGDCEAFEGGVEIKDRIGVGNAVHDIGEGVQFVNIVCGEKVSETLVEFHSGSGTGEGKTPAPGGAPARGFPAYSLGNPQYFCTPDDSALDFPDCRIGLN